MSKFVPSPQEVALVNQIFTQTDSQKIGVVTGEAAVKIFGGSKLPPSVLAEIWNLSDEDNKGVLTRKDVAVAVRLLGHAQRGETISEALIHRPGAPPSIEGLNVPISGQGTGGRVAKSPPPGPGSALPPLTAQDKAKFAKLFHGYGPQNGLLPGDKARDVFVKSKLPVDKLSQIWALADSKSRGSLDVTDFTIAMYLIQGSMSGTLPTIPPFLPPYIYEQAKSGPDAVVSHGTGSSTSFSPSLAGGFPGRPVQPQYTGQGILQPQYTGQGILQPQSTGHRPTPPIPPRSTNVSNISNLSHSSPFSIPAQTTGQQWDVTPAEKASADSFFDTLDTQKRGYIEGDVAVPFMLQSKLSDDILAQIWDLSDMDNNGRLTRDGFAVAFHLIQSKLAGKDIPSTLPPSLVPPSKRGNLPAAAPPQPQVPEAIKDLLWDDTPPQSAVPQPSIPTLQPQRTGALSPQPTAQPTQPPQPTTSAFGTDPFAPTSSPFGNTSSPFTTPAVSSPFTVPAAAPPPPIAHKDLLGDDDEPVAASPPLQDKSAEIGNVQNQLSSTNRAVETAKQEREDLERRVAEQESQLSSLQTQLSSSKAAYESETHTLATLRERYSAQTAEIQKTRTELIHAESNLSAIREEKNEVSSNLLRDKDEVRELQRKMTEVGLEVESLKAEVEKAKKDAKQQKGLLAIAKKQLATREAERAKIAKELEEAQAEAAQATKEREEAEAELAKVPEVPAAVPAPERVASPAQSITAFAAAQPLPSSPEATPSQIASPASTKSNNPFERLAFGGSPRPESPFLPFAGSVLPTPPTGGDAEQTPTIAAPAPAPATAAPTTEVPQSADPFGFDDAFGGGENKPSEQEPQTATSIPEGSPFGTVAQDQDNEVQHIPGTPFDVMSPTDTELFHTPPSTAVPILGGSPASTTATPAPESKEPQSFASAFPENEAPKDQGKEDEQTDLNTQLKELDVNESDSDTDSDDDEPLTNVKAKLAESHPENGEAKAGTSAFDDAFSAPSPTAPAPAPAPVVAESSTPVQAPEPAATETTPKPPAAPFTAPEASKQNGSADSGAPAGVSDFDEALGLSGSGTNTSQFTHVSDFTFDSAFDDDFDFAAAKAATSDPAVNGTNASAPSPAAAAASTPTTGSYFPPPAISPPSTSQVSTTSPFPAAPTSTSAFPAAPSAATRPKSEAFDAIFLPQASQNKSAEGSSVPPSAGPSQTLSFDDTFGGDSSAPKAAPPVTQPATSNGGHGISFDDAFGGNPTESLALDSSFSSSTQSQHYAPPSSPPPGLKGTTPFPSSTPASPTRDGQSSRRSLSPAPRTASPPPRPKSRPSTSQSEKDGKEKTTRHSKLSIRLPFGRKKAKHDPMPSQLSHSLLVEEPSNDATPAADDDIEAVKTLCGMGFSRTQAVTALEQYDYDVQRALNSLLGTR